MPRFLLFTGVLAIAACHTSATSEASFPYACRNLKEVEGPHQWAEKISAKQADSIISVLSDEDPPANLHKQRNLWYVANMDSAQAAILTVTKQGCAIAAGPYPITTTEE